MKTWISVEDEMPVESHSMFWILYGTPKWKNAMWLQESDTVLVAVRFEDGIGYVTTGKTRDGKWTTSISKYVKQTVTHWMPMPDLPT